MRTSGSENFTAHTITTTAELLVPIVATAVDVDGDGDHGRAFVIELNDTIAWYENDGRPRTSPPTPSPPALMVLTAVTRQDCDVWTATATWTAVGIQIMTVSVVRSGRQPDNLRPPALSISTHADVLHIGRLDDVDGDGDLDVLSASGN